MTVRVQMTIAGADGKTTNYEFRCAEARENRSRNWDGPERVLFWFKDVEWSPLSGSGSRQERA